MLVYSKEFFSVSFNRINSDIYQYLLDVMMKKIVCSDEQQRRKKKSRFCCSFYNYRDIIEFCLFLTQYSQLTFNYTEAMDPMADISDIMFTPEEQENRFVEIKQASKKLVNLESQSFVKVFYGKKTMRQLLDQRTNLCLELQLSSKKSNEREQIDKEVVAYKFSQLFFDCPDKLNEFSWAIIQDKGTIYGFIATQNKFAPLCKTCNHAIYISMRFNMGRVVCGNPKCKIKLLGEFEIGPKINVSKKETNKTQMGSSQNIRKSEVLQNKNMQSQLGNEEKDLIKKAAKRLLN